LQSVTVDHEFASLLQCLRQPPSTIAMTMQYVHHVEDHHRPVPAEVMAAGAPIIDPDECVIAMLSARSLLSRGNGAAGAKQYVVESIT
jgi:hypothetical protein